MMKNEAKFVPVILATFKGEEGMVAEVFPLPSGKFVARLRDSDLTDEEHAKHGYLGVHQLATEAAAVEYAKGLVAPPSSISIPANAAR